MRYWSKAISASNSWLLLQMCSCWSHRAIWSSPDSMCSVFWRKVSRFSWSLSSAFSKPSQGSLRAADSGWCSVVLLGNPVVKAHSRISFTVMGDLGQILCCGDQESVILWTAMRTEVLRQARHTHSRSVFSWRVIHTFF